MKNSFSHILSICGKYLKNAHFQSFIAVLAVLYLLYITFPNCVYTAEYGLDNSWRYAINYVPTSKFIFGRDTNFTYGPLGYLLFPMNIGSNLIKGFLFALMFQGLFGLLILNYFLTEKKLGNTLLLVISLAISYSLFGWSEYENRFYTIFWLTLISAYFSPKSRPLWLAMLGALSSFALLAKFSIGVSASLGVFLLHIIFFIERIKEKRIYLFASGAFSLVMVWQVVWHFGALSNFLKWLHFSVDGARGYSSAMSSVGPSHQVSWALICLIGYAAFIGWLYWQRSSLKHVALITFPQIFFLFKSGFVRQDNGGHLIIFFCSLPALPAILTLYSKTAMERIACGLIFILFLSFDVVALGRAVKALDVRQTASRLVGDTGRNNLLNAFKAIQDPPPLLSSAGSQLAKLPDEWLEIMRRRNDSTVGILPWEISLAPASQLNWKPNPTLQQYSAYTLELDSIGAEYFADQDSAPDFLIIDCFSDVDGRYPLWSGPKTWQSVLTHYDLMRKNSERVLLKRKGTTAIAQWREVGTDTVRAGQWIDVPQTRNPLFAVINFQLRYLGAATKIFFRIPPVFVEVEYENGLRAEFRLLAECASGGILMTSLPTGQNLSNFFERNFSLHKVKRFKIVGQGIYYYRNSPLIWKELLQEAL